MKTSLGDAREYRLGRIAATKGRFAWRQAAELPAAARRDWQEQFRQEFTSALGGLNHWERPPLDAQVRDVRQLDGYRRESLVFTTRPGLRATGYFLIPDGCGTRRPAVLCTPGHGRGVDTLVGIAADGSQRGLNNPDEYANDYALGCVARGYPTLALESVGFGERRDPDIQARSADASSCSRDSMAALMLGETLAGWRVWDAMRGLDYLQTRADCVDPAQLAVMGISGGGLVSLFLAALDPRIAVAVVSCYFNTFAASILSVDHCVDNYVPGLLELCEMPDLAALIAPRALFVEGGREDPIFPHSAFLAAVAQAQEIYAACGCPDSFDAESFDGGHRFYGTGAFQFLERRLPLAHDTYSHHD